MMAEASQDVKERPNDLARIFHRSVADQRGRAVPVVRR